MKILMTGAGGLIGLALQNALKSKGYQVITATRHKPENDDQIFWNTETGFRSEDFPRLESLEAVINLSGENIAQRWNDEIKKRIRQSRVRTTRTLVETFSKLSVKPKVFISASAIGFYGSRGNEILTEASAAGDNFLADICVEWENEAEKAEKLGIRTVLVRTGIVLSKNGGALAQMLTPYKLGVGGTVGSGEQYMSWIALEDEIGIFLYALENQSVRGAINAAAPHPATNYEFTKTLGEVLNRPTILPIPEFAVNLLFGEMGNAMLLGSMRVVPKKLEDSGYQFQFPHLKTALEEAIK